MTRNLFDQSRQEEPEDPIEAQLNELVIEECDHEIVDIMADDKVHHSIIRDHRRGQHDSLRQE